VSTTTFVSSSNSSADSVSHISRAIVGFMAFRFSGRFMYNHVTPLPSRSTLTVSNSEKSTAVTSPVLCSPTAAPLGRHPDVSVTAASSVHRVRQQSPPPRYRRRMPRVDQSPRVGALVRDDGLPVGLLEEGDDAERAPRSARQEQGFRAPRVLQRVGAELQCEL